MMDGLVSICTVMSIPRGFGKKGANNVALLIMKTLQKLNLLCKDSVGGELNINFDNCSGQNKNNTVSKLPAWLIADSNGVFQRHTLYFPRGRPHKKCG